jgi:uncharacterized protein YkwD
MRTDAGARCRTYASLLAAFIALVALAVATPAQADDCPFADASSDTATTQQLDDATVCLLNQQRATAGLQPLSVSAPLTTTAQAYAEYMVSNEHFAHLDEDGHNVVYRVLQTDPSIANRWEVIGENLGWGTFGMATPRSMVEGWMNSPAHRANILYPDYQEIGVGVTPGAPLPDKTDALTYTTVFGKIAPPDPPAESTTSSSHKAPKPKKCISAKRAKTRKARAARARCLRANRRAAKTAHMARAAKI